MEEAGRISKYQALVDTSSVVAHDLCAQLHVLQFCVEELTHHISKEGAEFLERMEDSTQYIASLVDTFRNHLKITLTDEDPTSLEKVYQASLELVKNHFFVILESVDFRVSSEISNVVVKCEARKLMNMIFALYSMGLEKIKNSEVLGRDTISIELRAQKENSRFANIELHFQGFQLERDWFFNELETCLPEKGRLRKYLGQTSIKEKIADEGSFLKYSDTEKGSLISLKVPLHCQ